MTTREDHKADDTEYRIVVANGGALSTTAV